MHNFATIGIIPPLKAPFRQFRLYLVALGITWDTLGFILPHYGMQKSYKVRLQIKVYYPITARPFRDLAEKELYNYITRPAAVHDIISIYQKGNKKYYSQRGVLGGKVQGVLHAERSARG